MSLQYRIVPVTAFQQNCSIVWCDKTNQAAIIDPGGDINVIKQHVQELGLTVTKLLLTHGHLDHVGGTEPLAQELNVPVIGPQKKIFSGYKGYPVKAKCLVSQ